MIDWIKQNIFVSLSPHLVSVWWLIGSWSRLFWENQITTPGVSDQSLTEQSLVTRCLLCPVISSLSIMLFWDGVLRFPEQLCSLQIHMALIAPVSYGTSNKWINIVYSPPPQPTRGLKQWEAAIYRLSVLLMLTALTVPCKGMQTKWQGWGWQNVAFVAPSCLQKSRGTVALRLQDSCLQVSLYLSDPGVCCLSQVVHWAPDYAHLRQPVVSLAFLFTHRKLLFIPFLLHSHSPPCWLEVGGELSLVTLVINFLYHENLYLRDTMQYLRDTYCVTSEICILRMRPTTENSKWRTPEDFIGQEAIIFSHDFHLFGGDLLHPWCLRLPVRHFHLISLLVVVPFKTSNHRRKLRRVHAKIQR